METTRLTRKEKRILRQSNQKVVNIQEKINFNLKKVEPLTENQKLSFEAYNQGKKHIAYKIKPVIKKKDITTPVITNQNSSPANNNPAIPNPSAPVKNEDKKSKETSSSNSAQPANVAPKVESNNNSAPAINASAKSPVAPPPPPIQPKN